MAGSGTACDATDFATRRSLGVDAQAIQATASETSVERIGAHLYNQQASAEVTEFADVLDLSLPEWRVPSTGVCETGKSPGHAFDQIDRVR
jgi:hypothetical protein